ncbi:MAG: hypothetical protein J6N99_06950, partial [Schwartzia sp.]|nr:hypothetical protein [Schwartzia sp. (in: firmicutes)]
PKGIDAVLQLAGKTKEDVDYFAFHQANKQIVRTIAMYAGLPKEKFSFETWKKKFCPEQYDMFLYVFRGKLLKPGFSNLHDEAFSKGGIIAFLVMIKA